MTTITIPTQIVRFLDIEDDTNSISSVRSGTFRIFVDSAKATFTYRPERGDPGDDWPDVSVRYPAEMLVTDDRKHRLDLDDTEAFIGTVVYEGRKSTFLFLEEELPGDRYDGYMVHLGGAALPSWKTTADVSDFLTNASMARISGGTFAPGRDIAFSSLPGSRVTEHDHIIGGAGRESFSGGKGNDRLFGNGGNDSLNGGTGNDHLDGGTGRDVLRGGAGKDTLLGGAGNDLLDGGAGRDLLRGGAGKDTLVGGAGDDRLFGNAGNDLLNGGAGKDALEGGAGKDVLTGGAGADTFLFRSFKDSTPGRNRDVVTDFTRGDRIDLSALDADSGRRGDQDFDFGGTGAGAHSVWYVKQKGGVLVRADHDGDARADFEVELAGITRLTEGDFIL